MGYKVEYSFAQMQGATQCRVSLLKDMSQFDCYGVSQRRTEAKMMAAQRMIALLNLLYPTVPISFFGRSNPLDFKYTRVEVYSSAVNYVVLSLGELKGKFYLYVDQARKTYCVLPSVVGNRVLTPSCPIDLLNDPVRFTDWSNGPTSLPQEAYLAKRLELYFS